MYNLVLTRLLVWLTPYYLRRRRWLIVTSAATWPLRQVYNQFVLFARAKIYRLQHNGQVCLFEKVLNDRFDVTNKRIYITDFTGLRRLFFWPEVDGRDVDFGETNFFYTNDAYDDSGIDFTIHLPADIIVTQPEMDMLISLANEYKLAGKNYNIMRI